MKHVVQYDGERGYHRKPSMWICDCSLAVYGLRTPRLSGLYVAVVMSSAGACTHVTRYRCVLAFIGQRISPSLLLVAVGAVPCGPKRF